MSSIELDYNKLNKFIQEIVRICPMHVNIYNITYLLSKPWTFTGYDERYKSLTYKTYNYHGNEVILHFKYDENLLQKLNRFIIKEFLTEFKLKDKRCLAIYPLPKKNIENLENPQDDIKNIALKYGYNPCIITYEGRNWVGICKEVEGEVLGIILR